MNRAKFEALVERALRKLPREFKDKIANVAVVVEDWADDATLAEMGIEPPDTLYGLYRGIDLTRRDTGYGNVLPDTITSTRAPSRRTARTRMRWPSWCATSSSTSSATTSASTTRPWKASRTRAERPACNRSPTAPHALPNSRSVF